MRAEFTATFPLKPGSIHTDMKQPRDPLDSLLKEIPAPSAPPWFAARTMARLRQERARRQAWGWLRWALPAAVCGCAAWLMISIGPEPDSYGPAPTPMVEQMSTTGQDEDLIGALEVFVAYVEERDQWPFELSGSASSW
ncbi:MAG: hypothetical protein OHK005_08370 [Candidatus Methylacidiphilales bacterium]